MPISNYALDSFVAQKMSALTGCTPRSLADEFPARELWIDQFILLCIFHNHIKDRMVPLAWVLIRRVDAALDEWELECEVAKSDVKKPSIYFKLLRHIENSIAALWQGLEFLRKSTGEVLFTNGDGSIYQRLNWVYNVSRHFDPQSLPENDLHRIWLTNDGVCTKEHAVAFDEIREQIMDLAKGVEKVATQPSGSS